MIKLDEKQEAIANLREGRYSIRAGAGSGKCISGDSLLLTDKGLIRIEDYPKYAIRTVSALNEEMFITTEPSAFYQFPESEIVRITTARGYSIAGTPEHRIIICNKEGNLEFRRLDEVSNADIVALAKGTNKWGKLDFVSKDMSYFIGLTLGDAYINNSYISFTQKDKHLGKTYANLVKKLFNYGVGIRDYKGKTASYHISSAKITHDLNAYYGLLPVKAGEKSIPQVILSAPKETVTKCLQGLFETDGWCDDGGVGYCTKSPKMATQVQTLLLNLGIVTRKREKYNKEFGTYSYNFDLSTASLPTFWKEIGFQNAKWKQDKLEALLQKTRNTNIELVYNQSARLNKLIRWDRRKYKDYISGRRNPSTSKAKKIALRFADKDLFNLATNFHLDPVSEISKGKEVVYDLTVPGYHNYIANGFINHNTATLIERTNRLTASGISPNDILLATFTKAAAEVMRERLDNPFVDCRTIHSFSLQILKDELWKYDRELCPFDVITGTKRKILLQKCVNKVGVAEDLDLGTISLAIGKAKGMLAPSTGDREIDDVWKLYEQEKRKMKMIDFDDMSPMAINLLEKYPDIRKHFQRDWILVDEAHDTSVAQHKVIELIDKGNLFLISSVEQCIFSWRSAAPELMVNIDKRYPDIQIIDLETNYRSADTIINAANKLISSAKWKSLQMRGTGKRGDIRYVEHFNSLRDEADYIASSIDNENSAILYRTNWYAMELELALRELDIEYHILGGLSFFDFSEIGDMIAYLKLAENQNDKEAFLRIFNRPNRYLGNKWRNECEDKLAIGHTVESVLKSRFRSADNREIGYWWKNQEQLLAHLLCLRCFTSPGDIISHVRMQMKYDEWWRKERFSDEEDDDQDIYSNLDEFELLARKYKTVSALLEQCKPAGNDGKENGVTLGTIHRAKGLEWNDVYGAGITSNLLPHFRNPDKEEERRLLYVLITRGIENVKLTSAFHKQFKNPSPLLDFLQ